MPVMMDHALNMPSWAHLETLLDSVCSDGRLWKLGSCFEDLLDTRPFSSHYNPTWFDTKGAMCVAYGITTKELASTLETAGIRHLKHKLLVGVNVKDKDDVPHDGISAARPQALYIVPVLPRFTTQQQFWGEHKSYYKQTHGGSGLKEQRLAVGLPALKQTHNGGKQPKKQVHMDDGDFVSGLIHSGIPLAQLDSAFAGKSCGRLNKLLAIFWKVPEVARELSLLFGGKQIRDAKYKRIKPTFERARKSGPSSSSSATLPLDATEPCLELELDPDDNMAAIA